MNWNALALNWIQKVIFALKGRQVNYLANVTAIINECISGNLEEVVEIYIPQYIRNLKL